MTPFPRPFSTNVLPPTNTLPEIQHGINLYLEGWKKAEELAPSYNTYLLPNITFEKCVQQGSDIIAIFSFPVQQKYANLYGTLHGGVIASLVDVISTIPIAVHDKTHRGGVSTDLQVSYVNAAKIGETVLIEAQCTKAGKYLAFSHTRLREKETGRLIATASHTKFLEVHVKKVLSEEGMKQKLKEEEQKQRSKL